MSFCTEWLLNEGWHIYFALVGIFFYCYFGNVKELGPVKDHLDSVDINIVFRQSSIYGPAVHGLAAVLCLSVLSALEPFLPVCPKGPWVMFARKVAHYGLRLVGPILCLLAMSSVWLFYQADYPQFNLITLHDSTQIQCAGSSTIYSFQRPGNLLFYTDYQPVVEDWPLIKQVHSLDSCVGLSVLPQPAEFYQKEKAYGQQLLNAAHTVAWKVMIVLNLVVLGIWMMVLFWRSERLIQRTPPSDSDGDARELQQRLVPDGGEDADENA